jgi:hypothetical protein
MRFRIRRPSPAMVVACLALGMSMTGVGYAASVLPRNSVGTVQVKNGAIVSAKVKDRSLLGVDFKAGQLPKGDRGEKGERGETGERGPKGDQGARGPNGIVAAYTKLNTATDGIYRAIDGATLVTLPLPAGRYAIFGRVLIASVTSNPRPPTFYAYCTLQAGDDSDYNQVRGQGNGVIPTSMAVIHQFDANGSATLKCSDSSNEASTWAKARITAVQVTGTSIRVVDPRGSAEPPRN